MSIDKILINKINDKTHLFFRLSPCSLEILQYWLTCMNSLKTKIVIHTFSKDENWCYTETDKVCFVFHVHSKGWISLTFASVFLQVQAEPVDFKNLKR